ncbi:RNA ligase [Halorubellus sp. PRR65]|uniref:RNA ligase n=1 Tax=Halorubellus sp. PRR65 TaxID=3098148 RepID=UPI002B25EDC8|nr:RNA ligase [Halorubellus sp. PRR65]
MDEQAVFERLDSNADRPDELLEHFRSRTVAGRDALVLTDTRHGVERGTVAFPDADVLVRGYPSIPRVLHLDAGIESFFADAEDDGTVESVVVEEKLDGFNVRVARVDGDVLAFTRSGFACPFSTARARECLDVDAFFDAHPERVLCAELLGPETPYTTHDYGDVASSTLRVFGVRDRETGAPLSVAERRAICERFGFEQPRSFGEFPVATSTGDDTGRGADDERDAATAVADATEALDAAGREGVVMKTPDARRAVKYTTEAMHHGALAYAFSLPFDYGRDFVFSRIVREAFQAHEFDATDDRRRERARGLGESILLPMIDAIESVADGGTLGDHHTVRGEPDVVEATLAHLRDQGLAVDVTRDDRHGAERVVEFRKRAEASTDRIAYYLDGGTVDE